MGLAGIVARRRRA
ncbi:MAG: hypothetical protein CMJ53_10385 [Planctomycetaceae bacterium]|nr:hypothetical protein [Planctomycetaceae bacterium]